MDVVLRCSASSLQSDGVYLLYSPLTLILWVGSQVSPQALIQLFNTTSFLSLTSGEVKQTCRKRLRQYDVVLCCVVVIVRHFHVLVLQIKPPVQDNPLCVRLQKLISTLQSYAALTLKVSLLIIAHECRLTLCLRITLSSEISIFKY